MREVFKYTFTTIADIPKFIYVVLVISILTLIEPFPFIGMTAWIFEKLLFLSIGIFLIYLLKHSKDDKEYYENLKRNGFGTFMFHFIPPAAGILLGLILIASFWLMFFVLILQFTNSIYIIANPHTIITNITTAPFITQVLIGFYSIYLLFYSYTFLGKLGDALSKESFKASFISIILSLFDFNYWIKTFNLKYFIIYLIWSIITFSIYIFTALGFIVLIYPVLISKPNLSLILIPLLVAINTILVYYTYFSAYFAHKTTRN